MDFIHKKYIIHRDLKLDNILITKIIDSEQYDVKIADFGLSAFYDKDREGLLTHKCGTLRYIAPEILRGHGYDSRCDLFSIGSIFFNLLTGYHLFQSSTSQGMLKKNMKCDLSMWKVYFQQMDLAIRPSRECLDFLFSLIEADPSKRVACAGDALNHAWFKSDSLAINELLMINQIVTKDPWILHSPQKEPPNTELNPQSRGGPLILASPFREDDERSNLGMPMDT